MIGIALPFCVIFWLLFTTPPLEGYMLTAYYIIMSMAMYAALTILDVPYTALAPEMTKDYNERTNLVGFRAVWAQIGSIVASTIPLLIVKLFVEPKTGWSVAGAALGAFCLIPILLTWRFTRGLERYKEDTEPLNFKEILNAVFGNRIFRYVVGIYLFSSAFIYGFHAALMYFFEYYMGLSEEQISLFFLILFVFSMLWVPAVTAVSNRIGKRGAFILFVGVSTFLSAIGFTIVQPHQVYMIYILGFLNAAGIAASYQLTWAMIADVVEVDEFKTNRRREGMYYGASMFILKMGSALSLLLVSQYLGWIGYEPNAVQTSSVILALRLMQGVIWGAVIMTGVIIACFMPMTRERHKALLKAIEAKKAGEPWDEESIKELM
jgi:GPH family glycoside/pentoside/hexuronide:cation symporter